MKNNLMLHQEEQELCADIMGRSQDGNEYRGTAGSVKNEYAYAFTIQKEVIIEQVSTSVNIYKV
jgi:hypothetical protein